MYGTEDVIELASHLALLEKMSGKFPRVNLENISRFSPVGPGGLLLCWEERLNELSSRSVRDDIKSSGKFAIFN